MTTIVDFHSHFFSRAFFATLAEHSPLPGSPEARMRSVADEVGIELPAQDDALHLKRWLSEMDRFGIGHLVSFASVPQEAAPLARCVALSEGRLTAFSVLDPTSPGAPERARELFASGMRGLLFFPAMHGFRVDGPEARDVLAVVEEERGVVVVHCGMLSIPLRDRFGLPRRYDLALANPLHVVPAADRAPGVRFVIPHFGAGLFRETLIAGAQCPNVHVDTSSSNSWIRTQPEPLGLADVFERALGAFGPERILFGTDSSTFPRGWRQDVLTAQREAVGACGLGPAERQRVFSRNAGALLGLDAVAVEARL